MKNDPLLFCTWLQGYFELTDDGLPLTNTQVKIIKDHLALVFNKVTPDRKPDVPTPAGPIKDEEKIDFEFPLEEWKKLIEGFEEKNKNPWINPIPQWPQNPTQPFWEVDKKTYNPDWATYPEIICSDKACLDVPEPASPITQIHGESRNWSIKDIIKNKTFC